MQIVKNTLHKKERLNSKKAIEVLFSGSSDTCMGFPLRAVFTCVDREEEESPVSILVSVTKKRFKRAVKRNRIKRQIREAYRTRKHTLVETVANKNRRLLIAFIYVDDKLNSTPEIEKGMEKILERITDKMISLKE